MVLLIVFIYYKVIITNKIISQIAEKTSSKDDRGKRC